MSAPENLRVLYSNKMVGLNIKVKKNEKGWFLVKFGELNNYNSKGEYYLSDNFEELISERNSYLSVKNRLESGLFKGEGTHPIREGHTDNDFIMRNLVIDDTKASHHIMELSLVETDRVVAGRKVIEIWAWILPTSNDVGRALLAELENPDVNVAFSIRCFSKVIPFNGGVGRIITKIITWDKIDIPGLLNAVKGGDRDAIVNSIDRITKEAGLIDYIVTEECLDGIISAVKYSPLSTESATTINILKELKSDFNKNTNLFLKW